MICLHMGSEVILRLRYFPHSLQTQLENSLYINDSSSWDKSKKWKQIYHLEKKNVDTISVNLKFEKKELHSPALTEV